MIGTAEMPIVGLTRRPAGSWMLSNLAPRVLRGDLNPGFMVKLQQKDLRLIMETSEELNLPLPATALVHQLFRSVQADGNGDLGTQSLITTMEKLAGIRITEGAAKMTVTRMRHRFRAIVRQEIAETIATPDQLETELQCFLHALTS